MKKALAIALILIALMSITSATWHTAYANQPRYSSAPSGWEQAYSSQYYPTMNWYVQNGIYTGYDMNRGNWEGGYYGLQPWLMYYPGVGWFQGNGRGY
jgi:hypothetical protein